MGKRGRSARPYVAQLKGKKQSFHILLALIAIYPLGLYWTAKYRQKWLKSIFSIIVIVFGIFWTTGFVLAMKVNIVNLSSRQQEAGFVITTEEIEQVINYETEVKIDSSLAPGQEIVVTEGKNGKKKITYQVKTELGDEVARVLISEEEIEEPINEVILKSGENEQ